MIPRRRRTIAANFARRTFEHLEPRLLLAVTFDVELLKDINPNGDSNPSGTVQLGEKAYFIADDGVTGRELWATDGTGDGTVQVVDLWPGPDTSGLFSPIVFNGKLYFSATDGSGTTGTELWSSDGTAGGTGMVIDLRPGSSPGVQWGAQGVVGSLLYFIGNNGTSGRELFRTDGTPEGTLLMADIKPGGNSEPNSFTGVNGALLFTADIGSFSSPDRELYRSDGTPEGTVKVLEINPTGSAIDNGAKTAVIDNVMFFTANDGVHGAELWRSDGTEAGTFMVHDINPGAAGSMFTGTDAFFHVIQVYNGEVYFPATDGEHGYQLWKAGPTAGSAQLVATINPTGDGFTNTFPSQMVVANGKLVFTATTTDAGSEVFITDGTAAGTKLIDVNPGSGSSFPRGLGTFPKDPADPDGPQYVAFNAFVPDTGSELHYLDTDVDPLLVDLAAEAADSGATLIGVLNGFALIAGDDGSIGTEPYKVTRRVPLDVVGTVLRDRDGNGTFNEKDVRENEIGRVSGVTVFIDLNGNGVPDFDFGSMQAEPVFVTDGAGQYVFLDRSPEDRTKVRMLGPGEIVTARYDYRADSGDVGRDFLAFQAITVTGRKRFTKINNPAVEVSPGDRPGPVTVYNDTNNNGQFDEAEPSDETDEEGDYVLSGLGPQSEFAPNAGLGKDLDTGLPMVRLREKEVPAGFRQTSGPADFAPMSGQTYTNLDFVDQQYIYTFTKNFGYLDKDGIPVIVKLNRPGAVTATFDENGIPSFRLEGTSTETNLTIGLPFNPGRRTSVGNIDVTQGMGKLSVPNIDVKNITVGGVLINGQFGDFKDQHTLTIGGAGATATSAVTLAFSEVAGADITSAIPIKSLTVTDWRDDDDDPDTITAPRLDKLLVNGDKKRGIAADFEADLILTGEGQDPAKPVLGNVNIRGLLGDEEGTVNWDIDGGVGPLKVGKVVNATIDILTLLKKLTITPAKGSTAKTFDNSTLNIHGDAGKITLGFINPMNNGTQFGVFAEFFADILKFTRVGGTKQKLSDADVPLILEDFHVDHLEIA